MTELEYVVIDPVLGEVSCDDLSQAFRFADGVKGQVFCVVWEDGEEVDRTAMNRSDS